MGLSSVRLLLLIGLLTAVLGGTSYSPIRTAEAQAPTTCFVVADDGDALWRVDRMSGASSRVGALGGSFSSVEAITLNLDATVLYAAHDNGAGGNGVFGTINMSSGAMTAIGPIGPASGVNRTTGQPVTASLNDVDSLSVHPWTGELWAITHDDRANKIFRLNAATGRRIPDTFGQGLDYVEILLPHPPNDVDDLAIDPTNGRFYIIGNSSGVNDRLYELNINGLNPPASSGLNATFGTLTVNEVGPLFDTGSFSNIFDMEGFAFFNDGSFYGTTGDQGDGLSDRLWQIDPRNGRAFSITPGEIDNDGVAPVNGDFESVSCLTAGSNIKSGIVFEDLNGNGSFDGSDIRRSGVIVHFYRDNGNGSFDGGDARVQTKVTDGNGQYTFAVSVEGLFFAVLEQSTLPPGSALTTVGSFNVNFANYNNRLSNNNFGFTTTIRQTQTPVPTPGPPPDSTPVPQSTGTVPPAVPPGNPGDPTIVKVAQPSSVIPGETVTFTITVTNTTQTALTGVMVTDALDGTFFDAAVEASATKGTVTTNGLSVAVNIGDLGSGESSVITIRARVRTGLAGPAETENIAIMRSNERGSLSASAVVGLMRLPSTGYPPEQFSLWPGLLAAALAMALMLIAAWAVRSRRRI